MNFKDYGNIPLSAGKVPQKGIGPLRHVARGLQSYEAVCFQEGGYRPEEKHMIGLQPSGMP